MKYKILDDKINAIFNHQRLSHYIIELLLISPFKNDLLLHTIEKNQLFVESISFLFNILEKK